MKKLIIWLILLFPILLSAQQEKYFNKQLNWLDINNARKILQTEDGGYVIASTAKNNTTNLWKPYFVELDGNGNIFYSLDIAPDTLQGRIDGISILGENYFIAGSLFVSEYTPWKMCVSAINKSTYNFTNYNIGDECHSKFAHACAITESGNIFAAGYSTSVCTIGKFLYLVKLTPTGEILLDTTYTYFNTPNKVNWIKDIASTPDGGAYLLATVNQDGATGDIALIKIDSLGNWLWHQVFDLNPSTWISLDVATSLFVGNSGNIYFTGNRFHPNVNTLAYIYRLNADHSLTWINNEHFLEGEGAKIVELTNNEVVIAGTSYPYSMAPLILIGGEIVKLDSTGNTLWKRIYGGNRPDYFYDLIVQNHDYTGKSGYVLCGRTESNVPTGGADAWLVRVNCMGLLIEPKADFLALPYPSMLHVIAFANLSQFVYPDSIDGGHYILDWGDGSPPLLCGQGYEPCSGSLPTHTYQSTGLFPVTLQAIVCNDTSTLTRAVCIDFNPNPQAAFGHEVLDYTVLFTNLSQNTFFPQGGYCIWDFGDGSPPVSEEHPVHTYPDNGNFTVSLTVIVCQDTSVYTETIAIAKPVGLPPDPLKKEPTILVYPNPAQNTLTFALTGVSKSPLGDLGVIEISLFSPTGQQVLQSTIPTGQTSHSLSVAHLPVGVYFYVVEDGGAVLARGKVAVVR